MIRPYLSEREWKIQLTTSVKFMCSKNSEETRTLHTKGHNVEMNNDCMIKDFSGPVLKTIKKI